MNKPWRNFLIIPLISLFLVTFITWLMTPLITKHYVKKYFAAQGEQADIGHLSIDFFPPKIHLENMTVSQGKQTTFSLKQADIGVRAFPLFTKTVMFSALDIQGLHIHVAQHKKDWIVAGINLSQYQGQPNEQADKDTQPTQDRNTSTPWTVRLSKGSLSDIAVQLSRQQDEQSQSQEDKFQVHTLKLSDILGKGLNWQGKIALNAQANTASFNLNGQFDYSQQKANATLTLIDNQLPIQAFAHFLPTPFNQGKGELDLTGKLQLAMTTAGKTSQYALKDSQLTLVAKSLDLPIQQDTNVRTQHTELKLAKVNAAYLSPKDLNAALSLQLNSQGSDVRQANTAASFQSFTLDSDLNVQRKASLNKVENKQTKLDISKLALQQDDNHINLDQLSLGIQNLLADATDKGENIHLTSDLTLDASGANAALAKQQTASLGQASFTLPVTFSKEGEKLSAEIPKTDLSLSDVALALNSLALNNTKTHLQLSHIKLEQSAADQLSVSADNSLESEGLSAQQADMSAQYHALNWMSQFLVSKSGNTINIESNAPSLSLDKLQVRKTDTLDSSLNSAQLNAKQVSIALADGKQPSIKGQDINLTTQALDAKLSATKRAASWQNASLDKLALALQGDEFSTHFNALTVNKLTLSQPLDNKPKLPALATIGQIHVQNVDANQAEASIDKIVTQDVNGNLLFDKERQLENLVFIDSTTKSSAKTKASPASIPKADDAHKAIANTPSAKQQPAFKPPYYIIVKAYDMTGKSQLHVEDNGVSPPLSRTLDIHTLSLRNLNTKDAKQATTLVLKAKSGKYTTLDGKMTIWPMAEKLTMKSELKLAQADLPPYSPYIASVLGYQIDSGQLDLDLKLNADKGNLSGNSQINLKQFDLGGTYKSSAAIQSGVIPLNIAVSALKDSNNNISLNIPLSGDINSPSFGWSDFLFIPVKKALFQASSTYLLQTFIPYANVLSIAQIAGEQLLKIRVQPLIYQPKETTVDNKQTVFLKQLVTLLKDKKDSDLKLCGIASYTDLGLPNPPAKIDDRMRQAANNIADERAQKLKDYLVGHNINSSRLFVCAPALDFSGNSKPRVELNF